MLEISANLKLFLHISLSAQLIAFFQQNLSDFSIETKKICIYAKFYSSELLREKAELKGRKFLEMRYDGVNLL